MLKTILGDLPYTAELYWALRHKGQDSVAHISLKRLRKYLPQWKTEALAARKNAPAGKNVLLFGMQRIWIEHVVRVGITLAGIGHEVSVAYMPYMLWRVPRARFDVRRQNLHVQEVLELGEPLIQPISMYDVPSKKAVATGLAGLPEDIATAVTDRAFRDTQYALGIEEIELDSELYNLRLSRNVAAAHAALHILKEQRPDVVILPNGSILEFGVVYEIAKYLGVPVVTYEFGEQDHRIWIAQNSDVMLLENDDIWAARGSTPLNDAEWDRIRTLFETRQGGRVWKTFTRQWQDAPSLGGAQVKKELGLDERPVVLVATNVLGDSLTLRREIFASMTEWLRGTIRYFSDRPDCQLVVRLHPGEKLSTGPSIMKVLEKDFPEVPQHIHLIPYDAPVNTYDLLDFATLGIVFTTTIGLELAMSGKPVVVVGKTHYREKGFTLDPDSWDSYFDTLDLQLKDAGPNPLPKEQIDLAWRYAYRFFFEYPLPFPWHLRYYRKKFDEWSIKDVLSPDGMAQFGKTFEYLVGKPIDWASVPAMPVTKKLELDE